MEENNILNNHKISFGYNSYNNIISPSFLINLNTHSTSDENRNLILMELLNDAITLSKLKIEPDNFENQDDYHKSFPFQNCRIININNSSYIIGGKLNDNISKLNHDNQLGVKNCYKIIYNKDEKKVKIFKLCSTIYGHQSHSLLYLQKYKTIVLCSGHQINNCEYLFLENNEKISKWKNLYPLRKCRENAISLLFNEQYIFLIGGNDSNGRINEDYDMLNYEIFINGKYQKYWKTYSFNNNNLLLKQKGSGIIYYNNKIFIFGGYNSKNEFYSWEILFGEDKENQEYFFDGNLEQKYKISSAKLCTNINNYINSQFENKTNYSFCGEQVFMNYKDFFVNISFGGQNVIIPKSILN